MPLLNKCSYELALVTAAALKCSVNELSSFDRKHYFYADSPSGYQVTQQSLPVAEDGRLAYLWRPAPDSVQLSHARITRIQLEQDTGKTLQDSTFNRSLIDFNRSGVALLEIVTGVDFYCGSQAMGFVHEMQLLLRQLRVCHAQMSQGHMRVDCNVSMSHPDIFHSGVRTEIKNVGTLQSVKSAIDFEVERQRQLYESGNPVLNETRAFDLASGETVSMRDKEVVQDYRFMKEPNLPPFRVHRTCASHAPGEDVLCLECSVSRRAADAVSRPTYRRRRNLMEAHKISYEESSVLLSDVRLADLFEQAYESLMQPETKVAQPIILRGNSYSETVCRELIFWLTGPVASEVQSQNRLPILPSLVAFIRLSLSGRIFGRGAETLLPKLSNMHDESTLSKIAEEGGFLLCVDRHLIRKHCKDVLLGSERKVNEIVSVITFQLRKFGTGEIKSKKLVKSLTQNVLKRPAASSFNPSAVKAEVESLLRSQFPTTK